MGTIGDAINQEIDLYRHYIMERKYTAARGLRTLRLLESYKANKILEGMDKINRKANAIGG